MVGVQILNTRQVGTIAITSLLVFLTSLAVALRFIARRIAGQRIFADDNVILAALFLNYGGCVCQYVGVGYGLGRHKSEVGEESAVKYLIVLYVLQLFWNTTLPAIKISILLFYRRLFPVRSMNIAVYAVGAFVVAWYISIQITAIAQCLPINYYWNRAGEGHCIENNNFYIALAALNLLTDVVILIIPIPLVWHLNTSRSKKIGLTVVFLLGTFVCITSIVRLTTLTSINPKDITWSNTYPGLWTVIEASAGIVAACLPSLMPIYNKLLRRRSKSTIGSMPKAGNHYGGSSQRTHPNSSSRSIFGRAAHQHDGFEMMVGEEVGEGVTAHAKGGGGLGLKEILELREVPRGGIAVTTDIEQRVE